MNDRNEGYTMTSIEFFRKIEESERSVSTAAMKVDVFKSMAERITVSLEGEVVSRTRNVHANEDAFLNLSEAKEELKAASDYYMKLVSIVTEKMSRLEDPEDEKLLTYHYLNHMPLTTAAEKMHRCRAWAFRRHSVALQNLDVLLNGINVEDLTAAS